MLAEKWTLKQMSAKWVKKLYLESEEKILNFIFTSLAQCFFRRKSIEKWNLKEQIKCAEEV